MESKLAQTLPFHPRSVASRKPHSVTRFAPPQVRTPVTSRRVSVDASWLAILRATTAEHIRARAARRTYTRVLEQWSAAAGASRRSLALLERAVRRLASWRLRRAFVQFRHGALLSKLDAQAVHRTAGACHPFGSALPRHAMPGRANLQGSLRRHAGTCGGDACGNPAD